MADKNENLDDTKVINEVPSSSKDLSKSLPEEAFNYFLQGKRHILVQDYSNAVSSLAQACELYVAHFGELALECGEVYFLYGKALFRLSQQQSGVLGNVLNEGSDDEEEEEEEKSSGEEESKDNEGDKETSDNEANQEEQAEEKEQSEPTDSPEAIIEDSSNEVKEKSNVESEQAKETSDQVKVDSTQDDAKQESKTEEPEEDDLELAWNTLETAKTIFKKQGIHNREAQLKIAEILQLLAEISMESDNNAAAIVDLKECLSIQENYLAADDRFLAESYYQLGLAYLLEKQYYEAIEHFTTTMHIIELRIDNLKKQDIPEVAGSFDSTDKEIEISNLQNLLPDIKEKIEDTQELIRNAKKELEEVLEKTPEVSSSTLSSSSSKPISNITHLLKRKKTDTENEKESESKRVKLSPCIPNGDTSVKQVSMPEANV